MEVASSCYQYHILEHDNFTRKVPTLLVRSIQMLRFNNSQRAPDFWMAWEGEKHEGMKEMGGTAWRRV
jgi:hypothetical protein